MKTTTIVIIVGCIAVIGLGIGLGVGLSGSDDEEGTTQSPVTDPPTMTDFTLQNYIDGTYKGKSIRPTFAPSGYVNAATSTSTEDLYLHQTSDNDVEMWNFHTQAKDHDYFTNTNCGTHDDSQWFRYLPNYDGTHMFLGYDRKKLWRSVSYNASYSLYNTQTKTCIDTEIFAHCDDGGFDASNDIQYISWAPNDGGHDRPAAGLFVCNFNIYYFADATDSNTVKQLTSDGKDNYIYNGLPEWAYEEEILGSNNAIYWNPSGSRIMFVKFSTQTALIDAALGPDHVDDHIYKYSWYGNEQYPKTLEISWAKAGTSPSTNQVWMYDAWREEVNNIIDIQEYQDEDNYFYRYDWQDDDNVVIIWTNREQTESRARFFSANGSDWSISGTDGDSQKFTSVGDFGWVGSFGPWWPMHHAAGDNTASYFTIRDYAADANGVEDSGKRAVEHVKNVKKGDDLVDVPEGYWVVARIDQDKAAPVFLADHGYTGSNIYTDTDLAHYDSDNDILYYYAAAPEPRHRQLHAIPNAASADSMTSPTWVSQKMYKDFPDRCGWIDVQFSGEKVIMNCAGGVGLPMTFYTTLDNLFTGDVEFDIMENNDELAETLKTVKMPTKVYGTFSSEKYTEKGYNYQEFRPSDFDATKKYPLVIEVYAGPEFQKVQDRWSGTVDFCQTMVSEYDIICASVDGRGSAFEGDRFMKQIYERLGQFEPIDQTDFGIFMGNKDYIDESKMAIWGWSYGGYTTTHTIAYNNGNNGNPVFACGVAVAPLASWRYYDIVYAERYLGKDTSSEGYDKAEVWYLADQTDNNWQGFRDSWYTLISGTADDNVHFMSPAHIEKKLVSADVDFDNFFYADEDHSIRSTPTVNYHVHQNIRRHLLNKRCLNIL